MQTARSIRSRAGFTLVEAVIAIVLTALVLIAALSTVAASAKFRHSAASGAKANMLAEQLMSEILRLAYQDQTNHLANQLGTESGESPTDRTTFDDVDDYDGWSSTPPTLRDGSVIASATGLTRDVQIDWLQPGNLSQTQAGESGVKQITVRVLRNGVTLTTLRAIRTESWPGAIDAADQSVPWKGGGG